MPLPKGINNPAVRAEWLTSRRGTVQAFDRLVDAGAATTAAARALGVTVEGVKSMRRSVERLEEGLPMGRGGGTEIDLGLALLSCLIKPGEQLTCEDIAAWCGCTKSAIQPAANNPSGIRVGSSWSLPSAPMLYGLPLASGTILENFIIGTDFEFID